MQRRSVLCVKEFMQTLRGEAPHEGVPTFIIDASTDGTAHDIQNVADMAVKGIGEIVTVIGKPFRQIDAISELVERVSGKRKIVIETSGRIHQNAIKDRSVFVPIANNATIVVKPAYPEIDISSYGWLRQYRFANLCFKFQWVGNDIKMQAFVNDFFNLVGMSSFEYISMGKVVVLPNDASNVSECKDVWKFCERFCMRYSGREAQRLTK